MVLGKLLGGGALKTVAGVIDDLHTSEEEKAQLKNRFAEIESKLKEKQMSINLADAQSQAGGISGFYSVHGDRLLECLVLWRFFGNMYYQNLFYLFVDCFSMKCKIFRRWIWEL